ncbi:MAG: GNAT family N-acetyltransferase [Candidatus Methanomethylophilaceae archaeon]|jgi:ribosomal protein S18 acetylase RimI-like enzyme
MDAEIIEITDLKKEYISSALIISKEELGTDYLSESDFLECLKSNNGCFCKVAISNEKVYGFIINRIFGPEKADEYLKLPLSEERDKILSVKKIGILDSASVDDTIKGKGIGSELIRTSYEEMVHNGANAICAMAWKSIHGTTNIKNILEKLGLEETISIQGYWNQMVDSPEGHHCPDCKEPPCRCFGVFYVKYL